MDRRNSIALNAEYVDPSYIRQYLSMWLFQQAGVPTPMDFPVRAANERPVLATRLRHRTFGRLIA